MTGVEIPDAILVVDGMRKECVLFFTAFRSTSCVRRPGSPSSSAPEEIGPEHSNEQFNALQRSMTMNVWDGRLTRELRFVKLLRERFP